MQLIGGMALNDGQIAEMKTGEGKTLVSTLAGYLNALSGNNVHIVTVNDYLARRDSEWMGQIYRFLGMDVGLIQNGMKPDRKIPAYLADVTYGTNSEFGFDYLRDNMVTRAASRVQRGHHFAIVDEVGRPDQRHHPAHHLGRRHAGGGDVRRVRPASCPRLRLGRGLRHGRGRERPSTPPRAAWRR